MSSPVSSSRVALSPPDVEHAVERMAKRIAQRHAQGSRVALIGIQTGGVQLARQLAGRLAPVWHHEVLLGQLDVTLHRDDLSQRLAPKVHPTAIPFDIQGRRVILVDDVLCSGRTARAALDALNDLGRPERIELAVLIDRGHRELPIQADFVGETLHTDSRDLVNVQFAEGDSSAQVLVESPTPQPAVAS